MTDRPPTADAPDQRRSATETGSDGVRSPAEGVRELRLGPDGSDYFRAYVVTGERPTLFDAGPAETNETLIERLRGLGVEVERLVVTHADFDHVGGYDAVVDAFDVETYVPRESDVADDVATPPDVRYGHGDDVAGFEAVHVPGHKPDNYAFVDEGRDLGILGDAVIGADRRGLPAGYFLLPEAIYSHDLVAAERNLERLLDYEFEVGLVYHGSSVLDRARERLEAYVEFPNKPEWDGDDPGVVS
ncbi:glyoxylase-like metal-dependent hydrolase (beta-lactamase superfamily II) [Halarchaeum solikamskense]|uniref:MBL fold metallo-hydrolase n=1 Tax=Halarchaeum nitratireducens TaxID=489913 RepID=UPI001B3B1479|nr:MBL fold metallo-hydrolase [Halarchaeum solikamskense]MBP2249731.1 glyoxylase-like metal-dependent hydrolase (beta-lactamase superfamily II) [Halarchaeum solikamskense]